jgi:molybdopterin-guanine dinucleotide biosynthesis protein A
MGPAAGIEAGLKASRNGTCLIVSCDTPMLSPALFRYLLDHHRNAEISLPVHEGKLEPLVGVYNRSAHEAFKRALENGIMSPREIIPACDWKEVGIGPLQEFYRDDLFLNLNTPQDLSQ